MFQVLKTENYVETADVFAKLVQRERKRGFQLPTPLFQHTTRQEKMLKFYQSLPGIELGSALALAWEFSSVKEFLTCDKETLLERTKFHESKVELLYNLFRQKYTE